MATNKEQFNNDMDALANAINEKTGGTEPMTVSEMTEAVKGINNVDLSGYLKNGDNKPDANISVVYNSFNLYNSTYTSGLNIYKDSTGIFGSGNTIYLSNEGVKINGKSFNKLYEDVQLLKGNYDLIYPSSGMNYQVSVVSFHEKYAMISKVGGMSYKSINLFDKSKEIVNSTCTNSGGIIASTSSNRSDYIKISANTKYAFSVDITDANSRYVVWYDSDKKYISHGVFYNSIPSFVFTSPSNAAYVIFSYCNKATKVQITKSSTVLDFQEYFDGIRHTKVADVLLNDEVVIPLNDFQQMEGYGVGINEGCYNYLDFDKDVLVKKVVSYTFNGTETIAAAGTNKSGKSRFFVSFLENVVKKPESDSIAGNILMAELDTITNAQATNNIDGVCIAASGKVVFYKNDITDGTIMLNYLKGKTIFYELAEPIENALPQIDTFIDVSSGGVITFENEYKKAVPYEIKYIKAV